MDFEAEPITLKAFTVSGKIGKKPWKEAFEFYDSIPAKLLLELPSLQASMSTDSNEVVALMSLFEVAMPKESFERFRAAFTDPEKNLSVGLMTRIWTGVQEAVTEVPLLSPAV